MKNNNKDFKKTNNNKEFFRRIHELENAINVVDDANMHVKDLLHNLKWDIFEVKNNIKLKNSALNKKPHIGGI